MAIVHKRDGIVLPGQGDDLVQWCHVSIHAENTVGCDEPDPGALGFLELPLEVGHVDVLVSAMQTGFEHGLGSWANPETLLRHNLTVN
jgi:hypothetical protein